MSHVQSRRLLRISLCTLALTPYYALRSARYMKAIGILKTSEFKSNAQNARALEVMIPCHNNAATCYIKLKNYGDARLLSENVSRVTRQPLRDACCDERCATCCDGDITLILLWLLLGGAAHLIRTYRNA